MNDNKREEEKLAVLRKKAEVEADKNAERAHERLELMSTDEIRKLLHELRVHQIELEMQNEELRRAQDELEMSQAQYYDLYDMAPVGYLSVSEKGIILQANLAVSNLLQVARSELVGKPFSAFISKEYQDAHYLRRKKLLETKEPQAYEIMAKRADGSLLWAQVETSVTRDAQTPVVYRAVLSDITDRKKAQASLAKRELMFLSRRMIQSQEEERKQVARELHDSIGQKIISMQLEIEWLRNRECACSDVSVYNNLIKQTIEASEELQQICLGLRPLIMDRMGFNAAMKTLIADLENASDIFIESRITPVDESRVSPDNAINLYRILQEALANIVRHSGSKTALISLKETDSEIVLQVKDSGCGIEEDSEQGRYNFGILGMRERANMMGGRFEICSAPGRGTHIKVAIPFNVKKEIGGPI